MPLPSMPAWATVGLEAGLGTVGLGTVGLETGLGTGLLIALLIARVGGSEAETFVPPDDAVRPHSMENAPPWADSGP